MENFNKTILVVILIITAGNLARNFFGDSSLKRVEKKLELTQKSLDSAIASNSAAKEKINSIQTNINTYKVKNELLQTVIDTIDIQIQKSHAATWDIKLELDSMLKAKREKLIILKNKSLAFD